MALNASQVTLIGYAIEDGFFNNLKVNTSQPTTEMVRNMTDDDVIAALIAYQTSSISVLQDNIARLQAHIENQKSKLAAIQSIVISS